MDEHSVHLRPPVWLPIAVVLIAGGSYIYGKTIETRHMDQVTISVSGEGTVYANPDIAQLSFGVTTGRVKTAQEAMESLAESMEAVIEAVEGQGVEEKDITTQSLSLRPSYDWDDGRRIDEGFEASQNLSVKVRDMDSIGTVLTAAAAAGANQVGGVSFTIDDPDVLQEEARSAAIEEAEEKAWKLADDLGKTLGKLKGFNEGGGYSPVYMERSMAMDEAGIGGAMPALSVPTGEKEVKVTVSLVYELK